MVLSIQNIPKDFIFLHGLGQTPSSWKETAALLPQDIKAHCPDLFALCEDNTITYEKIYLAFEKYAANFSNTIHICGISLGAILALHYTLNHADKVSSLVLIAPQYKMPKLLLKIQNIAFRFMPEKEFLKIGITKQNIIRLTDSMKRLDFEKDLGNISSPTLIICGQNDTANRKAAKKMADLISDAALHFIDKAGHEVNAVAPEKLAAILNGFYARERGKGL